MTTVVSGLIKIGKTGNDQFENRMRFLESNGYANITGLKREFAIEVDGYDEKEKLIHDIFSKSRIVGTELFALDIEVAKSLLSSLDGKQIYPKDKSKKGPLCREPHYPSYPQVTSVPAGLAMCCALHYLNKGRNSDWDYITPLKKGQSTDGRSYLWLR